MCDYCNNIDAFRSNAKGIPPDVYARVKRTMDVPHMKLEQTDFECLMSLLSDKRNKKYIYLVPQLEFVYQNGCKYDLPRQL